MTERVREPGFAPSRADGASARQPERPAFPAPARSHDRWVINKVRALGSWYTKGLEGGSHLRTAHQQRRIAARAARSHRQLLFRARPHQVGSGRSLGLTCCPAGDVPILGIGVYTPLRRTVVAALAFVLLAASAASAQTADGGPDPATVRVRIGPLWMNPTISLPNIGIDTNVFNDPPNVTPKRDFTITVSPKTELWLRLGRTWLSGIIAEDIVWYQTYTTERSVEQHLQPGLEGSAQSPGAVDQRRRGSSTRDPPRLRNRCARSAQRADIRRKRRDPRAREDVHWRARQLEPGDIR